MDSMVRLWSVLVSLFVAPLSLSQSISRPSLPCSVPWEADPYGNNHHQCSLAFWFQVGVRLLEEWQEVRGHKVGEVGIFLPLASSFQAMFWWSLYSSTYCHSSCWAAPSVAFPQHPSCFLVNTRRQTNKYIIKVSHNKCFNRDIRRVLWKHRKGAHNAKWFEFLCYSLLNHIFHLWLMMLFFFLFCESFAPKFAKFSKRQWLVHLPNGSLYLFDFADFYLAFLFLYLGGYFILF